jgi:hypothetical protein
MTAPAIRRRTPIGVVVPVITVGLLSTRPYANRYGPPPR